MKKITITLLLISFSLLGGCAKFWDSVEARGGIIASEKAPYIIINSSGGVIQDVYLLDNAIVQSPEGSDGWLFLDQNNNPIYLGGDVKTIRLKSTRDPLFDKYVEYHVEFENETYEEKRNRMIR